jgi:NADH dehydrogenase FAD-containing subunit
MTGEPHRVLIAGGGVAGLDALLALRALAGDRVALTLVSPAPDFVYRPPRSRSRSPSAIRAGHPSRRPR